jgi:hypothetical protein
VYPLKQGLQTRLMLDTSLRFFVYVISFLSVHVCLPQITLPQARQWCRRYNRLKCFAQTPQRSALESDSHCPYLACLRSVVLRILVSLNAIQTPEVMRSKRFFLAQNKPPGGNAGPVSAVLWRAQQTPLFESVDAALMTYMVYQLGPRLHSEKFRSGLDSSPSARPL